MYILKNIWHLKDHYPVLISFLVVSPVILCLNLIHADFTFYYDSLGYWAHSSFFIKNGFFSFLNYDFPLRGYLFSFLIFVISNLSQLVRIPPHIGYEVLASLTFGASITIVIPEVVSILFHKKIAFLQILLFSFLALYFWRGFFFYPLTDLPAFFFVILGIYILLKFANHWWMVVFTGLLWGGSTLLRPSYVISLMPVLCWGWYYYRGEINLRLWPIVARFLAILAGLILVFTPQVATNLKNYGIFSPFTQTQLFYNGSDLFSIQLGWGLDLQKYETNIGTTYPSPQVRFLDSQGDSILVKSGYKSSVDGVQQIGPDHPLTPEKYLELVSKYPLDFIVIYERHLFNGLDIIYDTPYVTNIYANALLRRFINYSIWFLAVIYVASKISTKRIRLISSELFLPAILALPSLLSIPTAIEVRFMLPLHFMVYTLVAFWILPGFFSLDVAKKKDIILRHLFFYACFLVLCFMLSANTYMGLEYGSYVFSAR